ncbi:syntaxin-1A [Folsomia candida]|uniref:Syntaxin-1A n=1 Tax=Folsomia candida TaxID=158441 RepID=A0A226ETX4_FOLCA|nr:syntaxin-1A [Folsomia candida]OXA60271.1 Syntaxin-1A [Folsomia candida]
MVRDRFKELQEKLTEDGKKSKCDKQISEKVETELGHLLSEVDEIWKSLEDLRLSVVITKRKFTASLRDPLITQGTKNELVCANANIIKNFHTINSRIKKILENYTSPSPPHVSTAVTKAAITQHASLLREFLLIMQDYHKGEAEYYDHRKRQFILETEIAGFTSDLMNESDFTSSIFTQNLLRYSEESKESLCNVTERYQDFLNLEKSVKEVHDLYLEMALLVENQAQSVNRIEDFVSQTNARTAQASKKLKKVKHEKRKYLKRKLRLGLAATGMVVTIALIVLL